MVTLTEDDRRQIIDVGVDPLETPEHIVGQGLIWGTIETIGDVDSFVFNLDSNKRYLIEARGEYGGGDSQTLQRVTINSLKWTVGTGGNKRIGDFGSDALVLGDETDNGQFNTSFSPEVTGWHVLSISSFVRSTGPEIGTYTLEVTEIIHPGVYDGPTGKAVVGEVLTTSELSKLRSVIGPTYTRLDFQWLRDGGDIYSETDIAYTLVNADIGHRISVRVWYLLADAVTVGRVESAATSRVVGNNVKFIGKLDQVGDISLFHERSSVMWMSFKTGSNPNGYSLDRAEVKFSADTDFEYMIPDDKYEVSIEDADSDFSPKEDVNSIMLAGGESISRGDVEAFQAPTIIHLEPNKKFNLAAREKVEDGGWSCEGTQNETVDSGAQPGWELPRSIYHDSDPDAIEESGANDRNFSSSCKFAVFGRTFTTDAPRLASLGITNTPDDGDGFDSGEIIQVTAVFTEPITAVLSMSINIGNRVASGIVIGTNTKTFVFEYEVLGTDIDGNGITFEGKRPAWMGGR